MITVIRKSTPHISVKRTPLLPAEPERGLATEKGIPTWLQIEMFLFNDPKLLLSEERRTFTGFKSVSKLPYISFVPPQVQLYTGQECIAVSSQAFSRCQMAAVTPDM